MYGLENRIKVFEENIAYMEGQKGWIWYKIKQWMIYKAP
jgi:hypothetical protein